MSYLSTVRYSAQAFYEECMVNLSKRIALTLKALRSERRWSLDKTAEETGVSKAMLGQIEREESSPTIATLWKIAAGFQTSFSKFLADPRDNQEILAPSSPHPISASEKQIRVQPIFPFDAKMGFEVFIIELLPGYEHLSAPHKKGVVEHVIAIDGKLDVFVEGAWKSLRKGEGIRFSAHQSHGYRNRTNTIISFHNIIHYPA
jgi:transcriptional regulator with XRE-family HTH domain